MHRLRVVVAFAAIGALLPGAATADAAGWAQAQTVETGGRGYARAALAVAPDGRAVAAWADADRPAQPFQVSERPPDGSWGGATTGGQDVRGGPSVAAAADSTTVGWSNALSGDIHPTVGLATAAPGGTFGTAVESPGWFSPELAVSPDGWTVAAWVASPASPTGAGVMVSERPPGGAFDVPAFFPVGSGPNRLSVAVAAGGRAAVSWTASIHPLSVRVAIRNGGTAAWEADQGVGVGDTIVAPAVAIDGDGAVTMAWIGPDGLLSSSTLSGGAWSAPQVLGFASAVSPHIAATPSGAAVVAWSDHGIVRLARRDTAREPFGSAVSPVGGCSTAAYPPARVDVDAEGAAMVVWPRPAGAHPGAAVLATDGTVHPLEDLDGAVASQSAQIAGLDGAGFGTVLLVGASGGVPTLSSVTTTAPISELASTLPAVDPVDCPLPPGARPARAAPLPAAVSPALRLLTGHSLMRRGAALRVPVRCPAGARPCAGTLAVRARGRQVGSLAFSLPAGAVRTLSVAVGRRTALRSVQLRAVTTAPGARSTTSRATLSVRRPR